MDYRYRHFTRDLLEEDVSFSSAAAPGRQLPDFDLVSTDGARIRKSDFVGRRPLLLTFGSVT